jgi:hypothetical protein
MSPSNHEITGDAGMKHLHLIPDSATHLDLSRWYLRPIGIKRVYEFLKTNQSITIIMIGNQIGDEGFKDVADLLKVNNITNCQITTAPNYSHYQRDWHRTLGYITFWPWVVRILRPVQLWTRGPCVPVVLLSTRVMGEMSLGLGLVAAAIGRQIWWRLCLRKKAGNTDGSGFEVLWFFAVLSWYCWYGTRNITIVYKWNKPFQSFHCPETDCQ